jgi:hypothetical protein
MFGSSNQLLERLCALDAVTSRGFAFERLGNGDILVHRRGHAYGIWQTRVDGYRYIPAGKHELSHVTGSAGEVFKITTQMLKDR